MLSGCGKTETVNYNFDAEIEKIISVDAYDENLLDKELQDSLKKDAVNEDLALVDTSLIGYEQAANKLPLEAMFDKPDGFYDDKTFDWLGEKWSVTAFVNSNNLETTAIRLQLGFDPQDKEYAQRKIRELSDKFLMEYGTIRHYSNIYEYDLEETNDTPIEIVASIEEAFITYRVYLYNSDSGKFPCVQIFFTSKDGLHDVDNSDLAMEVRYLKNVVDKEDEEVLLKTIRLSPSAGYIVDEPKSKENMTPEDKLVSGGVFYN